MSRAASPEDAPPEDAALFVAHHHPGRLRLRSRAFEIDARMREDVERWLAAQPGVRVVRAHDLTGSVLVDYDPSRADPGELLLALAARSRLAVCAREPREPVAQRVYGAARAVDLRLRAASGGRLGLSIVVPAALGLASVGSLLWSVHPRAPRWDNLLFWSVQFFRTMNRDRRDPREHAEAG